MPTSPRSSFRSRCVPRAAASWDRKSGSVETGLKGILNDGRLNATFALFRMEQDNIPIQTPTCPMTLGANRGGTSLPRRRQGYQPRLRDRAQRRVVRQRAGICRHHLNLLRYQGEVPSEADDVGASNHTLKHIFRSWVDYRLPGNWSRVSVGGGVNAQSRSAGFGYYGREQSGFAVWNSRLAYRFTEELTGAMNVNNIFDRRYFKSVDYGHNYFGDPRNVCCSRLPIATELLTAGHRACRNGNCTNAGLRAGFFLSVRIRVTASRVVGDSRRRSVTSTTVRHCRQCRHKDRGAQLMLGDWATGAAAMSLARFAVEERESRDAETGWLSGR
ncbi:TonB-dependent receptor domain-containing protein [Pseudomonas aeruginosa]